jgi:hypothetical protein
VNHDLLLEGWDKRRRRSDGEKRLDARCVDLAPPRFVHELAALDDKKPVSKDAWEADNLLGALISSMASFSASTTEASACAKVPVRECKIPTFTTSCANAFGSNTEDPMAAACSTSRLEKSFMI